MSLIHGVNGSSAYSSNPISTRPNFCELNPGDEWETYDFTFYNRLDTKVSIEIEREEGKEVDIANIKLTVGEFRFSEMLRKELGDLITICKCPSSTISYELKQENGPEPDMGPGWEERLELVEFPMEKIDKKG